MAGSVGLSVISSGINSPLKLQGESRVRIQGWFSLVILWAFLVSPTLATEEPPTIGITGGGHEIRQGQTVQLLISHASYPNLEDFEVNAACQSVYGTKGETLDLGHPDDSGKLNWTPNEPGSCRVRAKAPDPMTPNQSVVIEQTFQIRSNSFEAGPLLLLVAIILVLLPSLILWWRRKNKR